jgi:hypothetical protein
VSLRSLLGSVLGGGSGLSDRVPSCSWTSVRQHSRWHRSKNAKLLLEDRATPRSLDRIRGESGRVPHLLIGLVLPDCLPVDHARQLTARGGMRSYPVGVRCRRASFFPGASEFFGEGACLPCRPVMRLGCPPSNKAQPFMACQILFEGKRHLKGRRVWPFPQAREGLRSPWRPVRRSVLLRQRL